MAKKSITIFDGPADAGLTSLEEKFDLGAYESAVLYAKVINKPAGNFTYGLFAHEPVLDSYTNIAGGILTADGNSRVEIPKLYEQSYHFEFFTPGAGCTVKAVLIVEDQ